MMRAIFRFAITAISLDQLELAVSRMIWEKPYNIVPLPVVVWAGVPTARITRTLLEVAR
jgi:hypothetical protein